MEIIVVIIIIVIALISKQSGKNMRASGGAQGQAVRPAAPRPQAPRPAKPVAQPAKPVVQPTVQAAKPVAVPGGLAESLMDLLREPQGAPSEGESAVDWERPDEEGCLGGSMEHEHTEGESRAEHGQHLEAMREAALREREARELEEASARPAVLGDLDLAALRRAVIISEVLDRPKALRRG